MVDAVHHAQDIKNLVRGYTTPQPGQIVEGKGFYLDSYETPLGDILDIFCAGMDKWRDAYALPRYETPMEIGQHISGKGIYTGKWAPKDREDTPLGAVFNLFAAPERLLHKKGYHFSDCYNRCARKVKKLKNWHGHDGSNLKTDADIYKAIDSGKFSELEKWFIPTYDILENNLEANREKGALKPIFTHPCFFAGEVYSYASSTLSNQSRHVLYRNFPVHWREDDGSAGREYAARHPKGSTEIGIGGTFLHIHPVRAELCGWNIGLALE